MTHSRHAAAGAMAPLAAAEPLTQTSPARQRSTFVAPPRWRFGLVCRWAGPTVWPALILASSFVLASTIARADGGAVVLAERAGDYQVTVLASPAALHVGAADLSVLVQDAATGQPIDGLSVTLCLTPEGSLPADGLRREATRDAATNKLFYAAVFELPTAGRWTLTATVSDPRRAKTADASGTETIQGRLEVAGPPPRWVELWPWIGWPVVVVLLFTLREQLVSQQEERSGRRRLRAMNG